MGNNLKEYVEGEALSDLKYALSNGIKHKNCEWCWDNEKNNMSSHRSFDTPQDSGYTHMHLRLSNVCNFKCRMCGPAFSSSWAQENRKHKIFKFDNSEINKDIFRDNEYLFTLLQNEISAGRLRAINISGGEPLITDAHWKLLNFLIDN